MLTSISARNNLRSMKEGDLAFFYHSSCKVPAIVGIMEIVKEHSPDCKAPLHLHPHHLTQYQYRPMMRLHRITTPHRNPMIQSGLLCMSRSGRSWRRPSPWKIYELFRPRMGARWRICRCWSLRGWVWVGSVKRNGTFWKGWWRRMVMRFRLSDCGVKDRVWR
jgi:hypothetical protein